MQRRDASSGWKGVEMWIRSSVHGACLYVSLPLVRHFDAIWDEWWMPKFPTIPTLSSITPFQSTTPKPGHPLHPILFLLEIYCVVFSFCSSRMRRRRIDAWNILQRDDIFLSISFSRRAFFIERHHDDSFGLRLIVAEIHGKPSGNKIHLIY